MSYNPYVQQGYSQPQQPEARKNIALKRSFGSGLYLVAVILTTLSLVLAVVNIFAPTLSIQLILDQIFSQFGSELGISRGELDEVINMISQYGWITQISGIIALILPALSLTGMWLIWANSRKETLPVGTAGFTILKVLTILDLISVCFAGVILLIVMIPAIVGGSALDQYMDLEVNMTVIIILFFIIMIAVMVLIIIYFAKLLGIYSAAKDIALTGNTSSKVSMYVIVINFMGLLPALISIVPEILVLNFLGLGSAIITFLNLLLVTITFLKFRGALEEQKQATPPQQAVYNNPYQPYQSPTQPYQQQQQYQGAAYQGYNNYQRPYAGNQNPYQQMQQNYQQSQNAAQQLNYQGQANYQNAQRTAYQQPYQQYQQQGYQQAQQGYQQAQQGYQQAQQGYQQAQQTAAAYQQQASQAYQQTQATAQTTYQQTVDAAQGAVDAVKETAETITPQDVTDEI